MSKELTEKWWKNELPVGHYYIKYDGCSPFIYHFYKMTELKQCADANKIEVLSPVPTFDEYQKLKEQLDIATKALNGIRSVWVKNPNMFHYIARIANRKAKTALEKIEGVK